MTSPAQTDPAAWFAITQKHFGDPVYWPMVQAAGRVAQQAIAFAGTDVATPGGRDLHSQIAMATFQQLREQEARLFPTGHPLANRPQCILNREQLRDWLAATTTGTPPTVAKRLRLDDTLHADGPNVAARLARLVDAAQADGVFGVPGHEIRLWHGGDPDIYADGYFITIQPPSGPALARGPLTDADLLGRDARGVEAGLNALNHVGRVANAVLADQACAPARRPRRRERVDRAAAATHLLRPPGLRRTTNPAPRTGRRSTVVAPDRADRVPPQPAPVAHLSVHSGRIGVITCSDALLNHTAPPAAPTPRGS